MWTAYSNNSWGVYEFQFDFWSSVPTPTNTPVTTPTPMATATPTTVTSGATASASSADRPWQVASMAIDGDQNTMWMADASITNDYEWWQIDFGYGNGKAVQTIIMYQASSGGTPPDTNAAETVTVECSNNGSTYTTVGTWTGRVVGYNELSFGYVGAYRYWRISTQDSNNSWGVLEFEFILGSAPPPSTPTPTETPTPTNTPIIAKGPVVNHFPIPLKRVPGQPPEEHPEDYFFPIGWSMYVHDYTTNIPSNEVSKFPDVTNDNVEDDWSDGILNTIMDADSPWNAVWALARPDADVRYGARTYDQTHYVEFVDAARTTDPNKKTLLVWPEMLRKKFKNHDYTKAWSLAAPFNFYDTSNPGWYNTTSAYSNDDTDMVYKDNILINTINAIKNDSNLGGWVLADEPYCGVGSVLKSDDPVQDSRGLWYWQGTDIMEDEFDSPYDKADKLGWIRDDIYYRMKKFSLELQNSLDPGSTTNPSLPGNNHPIHVIIRHYENYISTNIKCQIGTQINKTVLIANVLHDDHYTTDPDAKAYWWKVTTEDAINLIISPHPNQHGFIQWIDGAGVSGAWLDPPLLTPIIAEEYKLRLAAYSSIIHGARGIMFFDLSKSNQTSFDLAVIIANEIDVMVPYLLTPHPSALDGCVLSSTISNDDMEDQSFIVRINPNNPNEAIVLIANESEKSGYISIQFPVTWPIVTILPMAPVSYITLDTQNNNFSIFADGRRGYALKLTKQ